jgi:hypothetical protein
MDSEEATDIRVAKMRLRMATTLIEELETAILYYIYMFFLLFSFFLLYFSLSFAFSLNFFNLLERKKGERN